MNVTFGINKKYLYTNIGFAIKNLRWQHYLLMRVKESP